MPERMLKNLSGMGTLIPEGEGPEAGFAVRYHVKEVQTLQPVGAGEFISSGKRIEGTVTDPKDAYFGFRAIGKHFTLLLADGYKLTLFIRDEKGAIANSGPGLYR